MGTQHSADDKHMDTQNAANPAQQQKNKGSNQQQQGKKDKDKNDGAPTPHRGGSGQRQDDN